MKKTGLLINPFSKKARTQPYLIKDLAKEFPNPLHVWIPKSLEELSEVTNKILAEEFEIIFVFGGDGTLRSTIQSFLKHWSSKPLPSFVILQGGTANLYSKHFSGRRSAIKHMKKVLRHTSNAKDIPIKKVNILEINGHYGFIFAVGGFANIIRYYMGHKERSLFLANAIILKTLFSFLLGTTFYKKHFSPFPIELKHGSESEKMKATTLSCATLPVGYILQPFYGMELNRCFSGLLLLRSPFRLFLHLFSLYRKQLIRSANVQQFTSNSLELLFQDPLQAMVDGDMLEPATKITVKLGPQINLVTL